MVFNVTFNNISAISWQSVLLVEETGITEENHRPVASSATPYHKSQSTDVRSSPVSRLESYGWGIHQSVHYSLPSFPQNKSGYSWQIANNDVKGNNKITELRTILQRESQNS